MSRPLALMTVLTLLLSMAGAPPAVAADVLPGAGGWQPAAGAAGDNTYEGFLDQPQAGSTISAGAPFHVSGWAVDQSADGWAGIDGVQVMVGSSVVAQGIAGESRPDVANVTGNGFWANSGFDALVPGTAVAAGPQTLTVVIHTPGKGSWSRQVNVTVSGSSSAVTTAPTGLVLSINAPGAGEDVLANNNGLVNGVAFDTRTRPELGTGVDRVDVYLDGPRGQPGSQFLGEATGFSTTWSITWAPTKFDSGERHHILWIYARSAVTGEEVVQQREINIVH